MFEQALDPCYATFGKDATYVPISGTPIPVRIIIDQQDDITQFGPTKVRSDKHIFNIRSSQVAVPARQAVIVLNSVLYTIKDAIPLDPEKLEWQLECYKE